VSHVMPKMSIFFSLTPAQQASLQQLLGAQQDAQSPQFHKFLTPEGYGARFGVTSADLEKVTSWLETRGFSDIQVARSRRSVEFRGTAGQVQSAFHTSIHHYFLNGEAHFANVSDPQLPEALEGLIEGIRGLHNFHFKPHIHIRPRFTSSISGITFVVPDDWETIYDVKPLYGAGLDGSPIAGETYSIVVVGQSDVQASDLANFRSAAGLPAKAITTVIPPNDRDPGLQFSSGDEIESDLDLEWANAIAKNSNILFVTADSNPNNGVQDAWTYAIDNNLAPILSNSYGLCEAQTGQAEIRTEESLFAQANAQGMTIVSAAGDSGAADCDSSNPATKGLAVDYPASSAYVTGVGGTAFTIYNTTGNYWASTNNSRGGSALQYIPEVVWNDTGSASGLAAGGGGASIYIAKPSWQAGTGVPQDGQRDVPDIALAAGITDDPMLYCAPATGLVACTNGFRNSDSTLNTVGGTSAGAPTFASVLALLVQKVGSRLGNVNPVLYYLAQSSPNRFHDVTSGSNAVPCAINTPDCTTGAIGFSAGTGYDQASGLGSIDAYNLLQPDTQVTASPTTLTIQPGSSATSTITISPINGFTGTVSFSCSVSSNLSGVTCSVPNTTVTTSGSITLTINAASSAGAHPRPQMWPKYPTTLLLALLAALLLTTAVRETTKRGLVERRLVFVWSAAAIAIIALGGLLSCGGGSSGGSNTTPPALALSCSLPANAEAGKTYSGSCSASGGATPYTYSISSGTLPAGLSINSSSGTISGTPSTPGSSSFTVNVSDTSVPVQTATHAVTGFVVTGQLTLSCSLPLNAVVGTAYTGSCSASGGATPYTYSISSGTLPAGLSINSSNGVISGTPTTPGSSSFTVNVSDTSTPVQTASHALTGFVVTGQLTLSCSVPLNAVVGTAYTGSCSASGGTSPYTYSISSGTLPAGLSINSSSGVISGTPQAQGTNSFTVSVGDSATPMKTAIQAVSGLVVTGQQLALSCSLPFDAFVGVSYTGSCSASGGTSPYAYSISSGALPAGLSLNTSTGLISGAPTIKGSNNFTVSVNDSSSPMRTATHAVSSLLVLGELTLSCSSSSNAVVGLAYRGACMASGGTTPYTYSITSGTLPAGLSLNSSTGVISGTPTTQGSSSFTVSVRDSSAIVQTVSQQVSGFTVTAGETGTVTVTTTSGGITNMVTVSVTVP